MTWVPANTAEREKGRVVEVYPALRVRESVFVQYSQGVCLPANEWSRDSGQKQLDGAGQSGIWPTDNADTDPVSELSTQAP